MVKNVRFEGGIYTCICKQNVHVPSSKQCTGSLRTIKNIFFWHYIPHKCIYVVLVGLASQYSEEMTFTDEYGSKKEQRKHAQYIC